MDKSEEKALIRMAVSGDQGAFAELVRAHQDTVARVAFRIMLAGASTGTPVRNRWTDPAARRPDPMASTTAL